jgi:HlyD family secretion protein
MTRKKRSFEQLETLYKEALISKEDYIQANEDYEYEKNLLIINKLKAKNDSMLRATSMITLESDLGKMREMLDLVHQRLDDLNVKATVDGQLGMLDAEVGQSMNGGQRIGHAEWYLGLCYLKNNYKQKAIAQFVAVASNPDNFHRQEAKNILEKLQLR